MTELQPSLPDLFDALIGEWSFTAMHPSFDDPARGRSTFEWLEGGAFLIQRSTNDHPDLPDSISVIGPPSADLPAFDAPLMMSYHDSRGVHRIYSARVDDGSLRIWRDAPEFDQRTELRLQDEGRVLEGTWQMRRDGASWADDLAICYRRDQVG
jgi:hypothetical protein